MVSLIKVNSFLSNRNLQETIRYVCYGATTAVVCWGSCIALVEIFDIHYLVSNNIATLIAWGYSYFVNKYLVFRNSEPKHIEHGSRFVTLQITLLGLTNIFLYILVSLLHYHYVVSVIGNAILMTLLNYLFMKFVVFKK